MEDISYVEGTRNVEKELLLGTEKIPKLIFKLAIPSVIAQLINILYNIVDKVYIGHMQVSGDLALTGLGISFPIIMIISAFSAFVGAGGAPLAAIQLGKGTVVSKEKAEKILGNAVFILLIFSVILTVVFFIVKKPVLYMFGASDNTFPYANEYLSVYLLGTVFVQLSLGLNMFISSQGKAKIAMMSVLIGAVTNIILDPIFIYLLKMGVSGAALATIVSQAVSAFWIVMFLFSKKSVIKIKFKNIIPNFKIIKNIALMGVSPFIRQITESAITVVFNSGAQRYGGASGDLYVGSITILQSVMMLMCTPLQGFSQGIQPIISYNFGAKKFDRVKKTFKTSIVISLSVSMLFCILTILFPQFFVSLFTSKPELINLACKVLPIYMFGMGIFGLQLGCQTIFMGLGQAKLSVFVALLRKVILIIPLAIILPRFFGVMGVYYSEPISDILAATITGLIFLFSYKKILSEKALSKIE